jgi:uncharacterized protein (TIGR02270 family)
VNAVRADEMSRPIVPVIVQQHVEDAALLHAQRTALTAAAHVKLRHLLEFDERLAAHLEGLAIADLAARPLCDAALASETPGATFVATVQALQLRDEAWLQRLIAYGEAVPDCRRGLLAAVGWVDQQQLQGVVARLLKSAEPVEQTLGIAACAMHRVDPGTTLTRTLDAADPVLRARALRSAGELGKREFVSRLAALQDEDPSCRFWAAWSAVLLGDRQVALDALRGMNADPAYGERALRLALLTLPVARAHEELRLLGQSPERLRLLIQGAGWVGDPAYVPWLLKHMRDEALARLAGEAFSLITGADLSQLDLDRPAPADRETGPNDDASDSDVAQDQDDGLPWPDPQRIDLWWRSNSSRFATGQRVFVGAPVSRAHCVEMVKSGYQRHRVLAAHYLCLLAPGSVLFDWRAPSWRQHRILADLS